MEDGESTRRMQSNLEPRNYQKDWEEEVGKECKEPHQDRDRRTPERKRTGRMNWTRDG
jgi:hypothetical protein